MLKKCSFVFESDGVDIRCNCENWGFTAVELLGLLEARKADIIDQLHNPVKFDRTVYDKDGNVMTIEEKEN